MNRYVLVAFASCVSVAPYVLHAEGLTRQQITFISRLVATESRDNQYDRNGAVLVSSAGARGRFQLMPATAAALHVNPDRPDENAVGGLTLIMRLWDKYQGNQRNIAAAYNCGEACADAWIAGRRELPSETIHYIESVVNGSPEQQHTTVAPVQSPNPPSAPNVDVWARADREEREAETPTTIQSAEPIPEARPAILQSLEITSNQE